MEKLDHKGNVKDIENCYILRHSAIKLSLPLNLILDAQLYLKLLLHE